MITESRADHPSLWSAVESIAALRYRTKTEVFNPRITLQLPSAATMTSG
jgi:hypothetical protein